MKIRLLKEDYKKDKQLYEAFLKGTLAADDDFFSNETVELDYAPDFPIYMGRGSEEEKRADFIEALTVIGDSYIQLDRDIHFDERFWHSLFLTEKRQYILDHYTQVKESESNFQNIVLKTFDWENYVYKCVLAVEYIQDADELRYDKSFYYELVVDNLDIFNYIIKYPIFRNGPFLVKILTVIHELGISSIMKARIKDRPDLGKDERYGRRVIFELNKSYPVLMSPLLDIETLKEECLKALGQYYDISLIEKKEAVEMY